MWTLNFIAQAINNTLLYATPLILAALGGVISEKSGVVNIGLEGIMTIGAFAGAVAAYFSGNAWVGLLGALLAGAVLASLHAVASISFKANQTISGIALNFIGPGLSIFLCMILFDGGTQSAPVKNKVPKLLNWMQGDSVFKYAFNWDAMIIIAIIAMALMWFVLYKTKWGLRVTAVGEHPAAADTLGVNVHLIRYVCVILSGALAGLGGAACSISLVSQFSAMTISGQGFIALAAVIFGKWKPHGAFAACLFFGFTQGMVPLLGSLDALKGNETMRFALQMVPYVVTLIVLITFVGKSVAPKADGLPYEKGVL